MANSRSPLSIGENIEANCEIGLDGEIIDYILESHDLQIRIGAEPFYLWFRQDQGEIISKSITSWDTMSPQYSAFIWKVSDGESQHPNARMQQNQFRVYHAGVELTRVSSPDFIAYNTEYSLEVLPGLSATDRGEVKLWLNRGFVPGAITYSYRNICTCVDSTTGYPNRECKICRGTSYPSAFVQHLCAATKYSPTNTVLIRIPLAAENNSVEQIGRVRRRDVQLWMQRSPLVSNYDLIMGTLGSNKGVLFEIVAKSESKIRGHLMHQKFQAIMIEESDIRYKLTPPPVATSYVEIVSISSNAVIALAPQFRNTTNVNITSDALVVVLPTQLPPEGGND